MNVVSSALLNPRKQKEWFICVWQKRYAWGSTKSGKTPHRKPRKPEKISEKSAPVKKLLIHLGETVLRAVLYYSFIRKENISFYTKARRWLLFFPSGFCNLSFLEPLSDSSFIVWRMKFRTEITDYASLFGKDFLKVVFRKDFFHLYTYTSKWL